MTTEETVWVDQPTHEGIWYREDQETLEIRRYEVVSIPNTGKLGIQVLATVDGFGGRWKEAKTERQLLADASVILSQMKNAMQHPRECTCRTCRQVRDVIKEIDNLCLS